MGGLQKSKRDVLSKNPSAMVLGPLWRLSSHLHLNFRSGQGTSALTWVSTCRFKVQDDEIGKDDLAAWACMRLDRVRRGYRLVHLYNAAGNLSDGFLLVNIDKSFT